MKRSVLIILFCVSLLSCGKELLKKESNPIKNISSILETKSTGDSSVEYLVSEDDIHSYIHFLETIRGEKPAVKVLSNEPVEENGDIVYYVLNFENGWQLVSADKRGPIVLGSSDSGHFSMEERNPGELSWIAGLTDDISFRRKCADDYYGKITPEALESEKGCLDFWKAITGDPEFLESILPVTKSHPSHSPGHWELQYSIQTEVRDSIQHLLPTRWHQDEPFNAYCPQISATDTAKCAVGCGAVAAAQVLYYLHYFLGAPELSPTQGYCSGWASNFTYSFSNFSSLTWDCMNMIGDDIDNYTSLFIGYVAHSIGSVFGAETSSTLPETRTAMQQFFGISSSYNTSYDSEIVFENLRSHLPIIFRGSRYVSPGIYSGHAFVIDGYESKRTQYRLIYWWVYDTLPDPPVLIGDPDYPGVMEEITYSMPTALNFRLNWGYGEIDNTKYSTDGIWSYPGRTPYQYNRRMLYNFEESN